MTTTTTETFGEMCSRRMREYKAKLNNPEPRKLTTTCQNYNCPHKTDGTCGHNVWTDGLKCKGNVIGMNYRSQIQASYSDYLKRCEDHEITPMPRNIYLEG